MSKSINKKTVVKKVTKKEVIVSSDSDNESVSNVIVSEKKVTKVGKNDSDTKSDDGFDKLDILRDDLKQLDINNKDMCVYYYNVKNKQIYCKMSENGKWSILNVTKQEKIMKVCKNKGIVLDETKVTKDQVSDSESDNEQKKVKKYFAVKNAKFKKEQDVLFHKLKKIIELSSVNTFLSTTINKNNEKIIGEILPEMKLYHHSKLWSQFNGTGTQSSMAIIRKLFTYHGFEIVSKEFRSGEERGYKYYVVPVEK
jgi:hypothetical protein